MSEPRRSPITDSPWFWLYLFCTAGLVALVLGTPRFSARQVQIERQYQGRQRAIELQSGEEPSTQMSTRDDAMITFQPLYLILGAALLVGWVILWWTHFHRPVTRKKQSEQGTGS